MAWQRRTSLIVTILAGLILLVATDTASAGDLSVPVRIEIEPRVREATVGGTIDYAVSLRNAMGEPVAAPKQMTIGVEATLPSGATETRQVTIAPGATGGSGAMPVPEAGAIRIGVSNPELLGGGVVVFGKPGAPSRGISIPMIFPPDASGGSGASGEAPGALSTRSGGSSAGPAASTAAPPPPLVVAETAAGPDTEASAEAPAELVLEPAPQPGPGAVQGGAIASGSMALPTAPAGSGAMASVDLQRSRMPASVTEDDRTLMLYVPEAEILADGRNGTDVTVYLDPCTALAQDVVVRLAVTRGRLDPTIVTIPRGECSASTVWHSDRMSLGDATLSILVSSPRLDRGDTVVRRFVPPIHSLRLTPNPAEITLLNEGDVLAELHDDVNDVSVPTDRPMKLTLALREGNGALRPLELVFNKGDSTARAAFRPTYWGKVVVAGQIPFRLEEHAVFEVKSGARVFLLSLVGGLIGGLLAYRAKKEKPLRILIGLVTGFALFAFFLFFGAENILEVTGGLNVLNPVSVFLLSLVGGWAGTNVLAWALKRIGIEA